MKSLLSVFVLILMVVVAPATHAQQADLDYTGSNINDLVADPIAAPQGDDSLMLDDGFLQAQETAAMDADGMVIAEEEETAAPRDEEINPNAIRSLLFSNWEYAAISDAIAARGLVDPELYQNRFEEIVPEEEESVAPTLRELSLGGILYTSPDQWTIWLNGQRIVPGGLPEEILDLKVFNEYIELQWLDPKTMQIYPIRLRPHQRFNIDQRLFLPG